MTEVIEPAESQPSSSTRAKRLSGKTQLVIGNSLMALSLGVPGVAVEAEAVSDLISGEDIRGNTVLALFGAAMLTAAGVFAKNAIKNFRDKSDQFYDTVPPGGEYFVRDGAALPPEPLR